MKASLKSWFRPPLVAAMVGLGLLAFTPLARITWHEVIASYWLGEIERRSEWEAAKLLQQLPEEEPALVVLVHSLSDERSAVSSAAHERLLEEIDSWQTDQNADVRRALIVANCLCSSEEADGTPAASHRDIALRVLDWLEKASIEAPTAKRHLCELLARRTEPATYGSVAAMKSVAAVRHDEPSEEPVRPLWNEVPELADVHAKATAVRSSADVELPTDVLRADDERVPRPFDPPADVLSVGKSRAEMNPNGEQQWDRPAVFEGRSAVHLTSVEDAASSMDNLPDVLRKFSSATPKERVELKQQLAEQGLSEVELILADELSSAPSGRRQQLVETLPDLRSIDTRRWLKALAEDEDPQVRLAAMGLLVTTGDPALIAFVRQRATRDPERRIREQLSLQLDSHKAN